MNKQNERLQKEIDIETLIYNTNEKLYNELGGWGSDDEHLTQLQFDLKEDYLTMMLESNYQIKKLTDNSIGIFAEQKESA